MTPPSSTWSSPRLRPNRWAARCLIAAGRQPSPCCTRCGPRTRCSGFRSRHPGACWARHLHGVRLNRLNPSPCPALCCPAPAFPAAPRQDPASYLADVSDLDLNIVKVEPWEPQESDPGYNPEMNALPAGERPPLFGADGRPLVPRQRPAIAFDMGVEHKPVEGWREPAFEEEQPAGEARDEPGALPVLAMLWARFARELLPHGPTPFGEEQPPFGGRPEPLPPLGRPHPHHGMMHGMPHRHGMPHSHGMVHRPAPMHGEPAMRHPGLWGPGPMPRIVGSEVLLQRRDGRWVPLAEAAPGGLGG